MGLDQVTQPHRITITRRHGVAGASAGVAADDGKPGDYPFKEWFDSNLHNNARRFVPLGLDQSIAAFHHENIVSKLGKREAAQPRVIAHAREQKSPKPFSLNLRIIRFQEIQF